MTDHFKENEMTYDVDNIFTYHAPTPLKQEKYVMLRDEAKELAKSILVSCPDCPERLRALEKLEEVVMLANAAIARHP